MPRFREPPFAALVPSIDSCSASLPAAIYRAMRHFGRAVIARLFISSMITIGHDALIDAGLVIGGRARLASI